MDIQEKNTPPGEILRSARTARNMSQEQLATKLGVSMSSVNRWEKGSRNPQPPEVAELSKILDIPAHIWSSALAYKMSAAFSKIVAHFGDKTKPGHFAVCGAIASTERNYTYSQGPSEVRAALGNTISLADVTAVMRDLIEAGVFIRKGDTLAFAH